MLTILIDNMTTKVVQVETIGGGKAAQVVHNLMLALF
jgi:hypothetical protein